VIDRLAELDKRIYDEELDKLTKMSRDEIKKLYDARDIEEEVD
jgi:hypothetical protein